MTRFDSNRSNCLILIFQRNYSFRGSAALLGNRYNRSHRLAIKLMMHIICNIRPTPGHAKVKTEEDCNEFGMRITMTIDDFVSVVDFASQEHTVTPIQDIELYFKPGAKRVTRTLAMPIAFTDNFYLLDEMWEKSENDIGAALGTVFRDMVGIPQPPVPPTQPPAIQSKGKGNGVKMRKGSH